DPAEKPGISNLMTIHAAVTGQTMDAIERAYEGQGYGRFKQDTAEAVVAWLEPLQARYHALRADREALNAILRRGAEAAAERAATVLDRVTEAVGFPPR